MTHRTKNDHCPSCQRAKSQHKPARRRDKRDRPAPEVFGDEVTADHLIAQADDDQGVHGEETAVVVMDRATRYLGVYPLGSKSADDAMEALQHFSGPTVAVKQFYSDNAAELIRAAKDLGWPHDTSTPGRPATNGVAERAVKRVVEGTRTLLLHAGLEPKWWPLVARHFCHAFNIEVVDGDSAWQRWHGNRPFPGKQIPFGCLIDFQPIPSKASQEPKFAPKAVPGIFLGYHMLAGGRWKGDYIVVDLRDLDRNPDTAHVHVQRIKEVYIRPDDGFKFPKVARFNERHRWLPGPEGDEGDFGYPGAPLAEAEMAEKFGLADEKSPIPPPPVGPPPPCPDDDPAPAGKPSY